MRIVFLLLIVYICSGMSMNAHAARPVIKGPRYGINPVASDNLTNSRRNVPVELNSFVTLNHDVFQAEREDEEPTHTSKRRSSPGYFPLSYLRHFKSGMGRFSVLEAQRPGNTVCFLLLNGGLRV